MEALSPRRSANLSDSGPRPALLLAASVLATGAGANAALPAFALRCCGAAHGAELACGKCPSITAAVKMRHKPCCTARVLADDVVVIKWLADGHLREAISVLLPVGAQPQVGYCQAGLSSRVAPAVIATLSIESAQGNVQPSNLQVLCSTATHAGSKLLLAAHAARPSRSPGGDTMTSVTLPSL
jgi:hypothetical protein